MKHTGIVIAAFALAGLAACGGPQIQNVQVGDVQVRQVPVSGSGKTHPDGKLSLFVFIPVQARPLETRIGIVESYFKQEGKCALGTSDRAVINQLTRGAEGDDQRVLVAPVKC